MHIGGHFLLLRTYVREYREYTCSHVAYLAEEYLSLFVDKYLMFCSIKIKTVFLNLKHLAFGLKSWHIAFSVTYDVTVYLF